MGKESNLRVDVAMGQHGGGRRWWGGSKSKAGQVVSIGTNSIRTRHWEVHTGEKLELRGHVSRKQRKSSWFK